MRRAHRHLMLLALALIGPALLLERLLQPGDGWLPEAEAARVYAERALRTQRYSLDHFGHWAGSDHCGGAAWLGLARGTGTPYSDAWYDATQLMADAALHRLGQPGRTCYLFKTVKFLDVVARPPPLSGFYPRANVDGRDVTRRDTYADDNALIGLALLETRAVVADETWRSELLARAESAAAFLIGGGLWDSTFGGGFWWNTNRGAMGEGKPAQTTALAAQLFARLYEETGRQLYADRARTSLSWLEARLLDPATGLYAYNVRHWDMPRQQGEYVDRRLFSYDQAIMIEVHLLFDRSIEPKAGHLARARALAERLQTTFWDPERGSYHLVAGQRSIFTPYAAWISQSLLALHAADPEPIWLERARANLEALETYLLDPADQGYFHLIHHCRQRPIPGCERGAEWTYDPTKLLFSQAWMQRAEALLAARLAAQPGAIGR